MSWFTEIASKAESMLEKLDKNAAVALNIADAPSRAVAVDVPAEIGSETLPDGALFSPPQPSGTSTPKKGTTLSQLRNTKSSSLKATRKKKVSEDEEIMRYLNGSSNFDSDQISPSTSITIPDSVDGEHSSAMRTENTFLKSEIESLNLEVSRLLKRVKQHERDQEELISRQAKITEYELALQTSRSEAQQLSKDLTELRALKSESHFELSTEIERLSKLSKDHEAATSTLSKENARLGMELNAVQQELTTLRENFEKYRTRAQSVLSEKDTLIARLKDHQPTEQELQQEDKLENEEIKLLRLGNEEVSNQLSAVRAELSLREEEKTQIARALNEVQASLDVTKQTLTSAEHEIIFYKEELDRQRSEVVRLSHECDKLKTAQVSKPPSRPTQPDINSDYMVDLDNKVRSLTATLVKKQQAVEILTAERNAMRLQLEKTELRLRESAHVYSSGMIACDMNTTDDAKAGMMSGFLRERLVDSGMSRRVRRAYSTFDSLAGSLMRRHPLAKICLIAYMLLLHIWVLGILFTYTPDSHNKHNTPMK
ncbi:golgin-84 [Neocloeon triangulifer]|uniref:golgin-84 n=1 Tax=Neocloeon triangulifer TaxID=2078957 RepID=UPI00286F8190|nr:golgin-84 [Neocloeon triangulifer]